MLDSAVLSRELLLVSDYWFLIESTISLQRKSLNLEEAWSIVRDVGRKLEDASCERASEKFESSISKNPDFKELVTRPDIEFRLKMKYAPIVSADVERSFSVTKNILSSDRCSFLEDNLIKHYIIIVNKELTKQ